MKDAKGHGSDPHGAHAEGVQSVGEKQRIFAAIRRFDELRGKGTGFLASHRQVKAETGLNIRKLNFTPYREEMDKR